jgi:S-methylmethionine-dependent homocysteine/selenocysteine methylase
MKEQQMIEDLTILDGAMGTELQRRGVMTYLPEWSARALLTAPDLVRTIHEDYICAGADVITTNTFRTTTRALSKVGIGERARELSQPAVQLAKDARHNSGNGRRIRIAGSIAPLEDCYSPEMVPKEDGARLEHEALATWLTESGVDLILIETMNTIAEARAALRAVKDTSDLEVWVSLACRADGKILSGESIRETVAALLPLEPSALLVNCTDSSSTTQAVAELVEHSTVPVGAYANMGRAESSLGWEFIDEFSPERYAACVEEWVHMGASIVGGCCGTTPSHIRALSDLKDALA